MNMLVASELMKKYATCPECGNGNVGGTPTEGSLNIEDNVFIRSCKCGWEVIVDHRIHTLHLDKVGCLLRIPDAPNKKVSWPSLKEQSQTRSTLERRKIDAWLNTKEGRAWALSAEDIEGK